MSQETVRAGADANVRAARPTKSFPGQQALAVQSGALEAYLRMKSPAPRLASVPVAQLILTQKGAHAGTGTIEAGHVTGGGDFDPKTLTWNNRTTAVASWSPSVSKTGSADGTEWVVDVSAIYQAVANGQPLNALRLRATAGNLRFHSLDAEKASLRPKLRVTWSSGPQQPTVLRPSEAAISQAKWVQSCDYTSRRGDNSLSAVRVQIDPTADWAGGDLFDSGWVASTIAQLDLATTAYAGLADGATTTVRMAVRDELGKDSPWSDPVTVTRKSHAVLAITSPTAGAPAIVEELTPPITWTFTGRTQGKYRVIINLLQRKPGALLSRRLLVDSGEKAGTATSWTVPRKLLVTGGLYEVIVRAWDDEERDRVPGDPGYVEALRTFRVDTDIAITQPTSVTAVRVADQPYVKITAARAATPDSWTVVREETETGIITQVDADLIPVDHAAGAGVWEFYDHGARPGIEYVWRALPEVNGSLGDSPDSMPLTVDVEGIWLWDPSRPDEDTAVVLGGREFEVTGPDLGQTYFDQNGGVVRVISSAVGLTVSASSLMVRTRNGRTWREYEQRLHRFKADGVATLRLIVGNYNIPVVVGDLVVGPHELTRIDQPLLAVAMTAWQDGELPWEVEV